MCGLESLVERQFKKDMHWKLLYNWYNNITVQIKWKVLGKEIVIGKGTRQGGLTSTFLFNLFYKDLIEKLAEHEGGILNASYRFNVFAMLMTFY